MKPEITVIVPIYNAERWLGRCLDSIINQSFPHLEVLCVNDASTDSSLKILEEYARKDARITVIDLPANRGEGGARNAGLEVARGKYIGFVDSDDTVDIDFYDSLYSRAETSGADMIGAPMRIICDRNIQQEIPHSWFCSSIFRADFLKKNTIFFPAKFSIGDDTVFMARVLVAQPLRSHIPHPYYNYHQISTSASHGLSDAKCQSCLAAYGQTFSEIEQAANGGAITNDYAQTLFSDFFPLLLRFIIHKSTDSVKPQAAEMLIEIFAHSPYLESAVRTLQQSDPVLVGLLKTKDNAALLAHLKGGRQRFAAQLRNRLKKPTA